MSGIATTLMMSFLVGLVLTALLVPLVIRLYARRGWDKPHVGRRQHCKDTHQGLIPRGGGLAIFGGIVLASGIFLHLGSQPWLAIVAGATCLAILGWADDLADLSPILRLALNFLAVAFPISGGLAINFVTDPRGGIFDLTFIPWLPALLSAVYLVALTNITNWAKGIDGQLPGVVTLAAVFIGVLALRFGQESWPTAILSFIVAGSYAGFLCWNFYPQKIMPGYGGGALAGYFLGLLSILAGTKIATLMMVLVLPISDATFTIARRIHAGKSIFLGDRGHLHHKLLDELHWGRRRIAIFYWSVTLAMGLLTLFLPTWAKLAVFALSCLSVFGFLIYVKIRAKK